jgi:hypothetical protein
VNNLCDSCGGRLESYEGDLYCPDCTLFAALELAEEADEEAHVERMQPAPAREDGPAEGPPCRTRARPRRRPASGPGAPNATRGAARRARPATGAARGPQTGRGRCGRLKAVDSAHLLPGLSCRWPGGTLGPCPALATGPGNSEAPAPWPAPLR